jgi:RNA polymerase sigma factor (sigma-70 family)
MDVQPTSKTPPVDQLWQTYWELRSDVARNALAEHYYPMLPRWIRRAAKKSGAHRYKLSDVSGEAALGLLAGIAKYRAGMISKADEPVTPARWLRFVVYRRVRRYLAQDERRRCRERDMSSLRLEGHDDLSPVHTIRASAIPDGQRRAIREHVDFLPARQQTIVRWHFYDGETITALAASLAISESTIKRDLATALATMKKHLKPPRENP